MHLLLAAILSVSTQRTEDEFPLRQGSRWTYARDGRESMALHVLGKERLGSSEAIVVRIRGGEFFLFSQEDLWLSVDQDGLKIHAHGDSDKRTSLEPPLLLLSTSRNSGANWNSLPVGKLRASVQNIETVHVPAGDFKSLRIDYILVGDSGSEYSFRVWFVPGTGFVKIEMWQQSFKGEKMPNKYSYELVRYERDRKLTPVPQVILDPGGEIAAARLIPRLSAEKLEDREKAVKELIGMGRGVIPLLRSQREEAREPELRGRIEQVLERFPKIEFLVRQLRTTAKVGEPLPIEFALRNVTDSKIQILPSLGGLSRYPRYSIELRDEKGELQSSSKAASVICTNENAIELRDFITLEPGEETNPFGPGSLEIAMHPWVPRVPGTYTLTALYDASGNVPEEWKGSAPRMDPRCERLLREMPRGRFETNRLNIKVEP